MERLRREGKVQTSFHRTEGRHASDPVMCMKKSQEDPPVMGMPGAHSRHSLEAHHSEIAEVRHLSPPGPPTSLQHELISKTEHCHFLTAILMLPLIAYSFSITFLGHHSGHPKLCRHPVKEAQLPRST